MDNPTLEEEQIFEQFSEALRVIYRNKCDKNAIKFFEWVKPFADKLTQQYPQVRNTVMFHKLIGSTYKSDMLDYEGVVFKAVTDFSKEP